MGNMATKVVERNTTVKDERAHRQIISADEMFSESVDLNPAPRHFRCNVGEGDGGIASQEGGGS